MWITNSDVRKLTDRQKADINEAKRKANEVIRARRKAITAEIRKLEKLEKTAITRSVALTCLDDQLNELKPVTGRPAHVSVNGGSVCLDYDLLYKLDRSLAKRYWHRTMWVQPGISLTIEYQTGTAELYELPSYWVGMLSDLPIIEL